MTSFFRRPLGSRSPGTRRGHTAARGWPRALLFVLLACLLVQGTAVQAHLHLAVTGGSSVVTDNRQVVDRAAGDDDRQGACLLCVTAASAGHYLLASGHALPAPPARVLGTDPQTISEFRLLSRSHRWQSRAPPQ